jgi:hypothetical protein
MNGILVIDNFLSDPNFVRNYALSVNYFDNSEKDSTFPGKRSAVMAEINPEYNVIIFNKISKLLYNVSDSSYTIDIKSSFQIVYEKYKRGWVHADNVDVDLAGVLYLNPNAPIDSGTEFYKIKNINNDGLIDAVSKTKKQFVTNQIEFDEAKKALFTNNLQYELTDYISNKYNRLVLYPAAWYHCARNYFGDTDDNARLTQVFFIKCLSHNSDHKYFLDEVRATRLDKL